MFSITDRRGLYRLSTGLADARMAVRALRVQITPAFAIDTCRFALVCAPPTNDERELLRKT